MEDLLSFLEEKESSASVNGDEDKMVGVLTLSGDETMVWEPVLEVCVSVSLPVSDSGLLQGIEPSGTGVGTEISMISSFAPEPSTSEELLESDFTINRWCSTGEATGDFEEGEEGEGGGGLGEEGRNL